MISLKRLHSWPWLTLQIVAANVAIIIALAAAWYFVFIHQSSVYSERLMTTFNIEPGRLHAMYVEDVERQLWASVFLGLFAATLASIGLAFLIVRPLRSLARATERLRHGDYRVRSTIERGEVGRLASKVRNARHNRQGTGQRQIRRLCANLRPRGRMQERVLPPLPFLVSHGKSLAKALVEAADPFCTEHGVLEL